LNRLGFLVLRKQLQKQDSVRFFSWRRLAFNVDYTLPYNSHLLRDALDELFFRCLICVFRREVRLRIGCSLVENLQLQLLVGDLRSKQKKKKEGWCIPQSVGFASSAGTPAGTFQSMGAVFR